MKDIIEMAREAFACRFSSLPISEGRIKAFADLIRADEREACAALVEANAMACHSTIYVSLLQSNADAIRARGEK